MHIPWNDLQLFLAITDGGSLSAAAKQLRVTQPTVSRRVAELESMLGEALFARSVEGVTLTSFGERLMEPARRMAEWAGEADRAAERLQTTPRGSVRITAAPGIAFDFLAPFAAFAKTRLPDVHLEVVASLKYLDLSRREADLALRFAAPAQRDVDTLGTIDLEVAAFASPAYAKTLPRRYGPADVAWIAWAPPLDELPPNPELARMIPGFTPSFASDDFLVQVRAAEAGLGAMFLGRVEHRFIRSALVELDLDVGVIPRTLYLAAARSAMAIPRVRAMADLLMTELGRTVAKKKSRR